MTDRAAPEMADDLAVLGDVLDHAKALSLDIRNGLRDRPAGVLGDEIRNTPLAASGLGAKAALDELIAEYGDGFSASAGPRYLGFVTGGTTPAALAADWLVGALDMNVGIPGDSAATLISVEAHRWLMDLFGLPRAEFDGAFTTGATGANLMGLIAAREWAGEGAGISIAEEGLAAAPPIKVFSACPHSSFVKAARLSGLGAKAIEPVGNVGDTEAMDPAALDATLSAAPRNLRKIVCASAGTVTGTAFDDLPRIAEICRRRDAWLHVDGAFGLFARVVPELAHLCAGVELADSIAVDGHKWLNVPYDCGFYFTRHIGALERASGPLPAYLDVGGDIPFYLNRNTEMSQRFRALPVWATLKAYGADGVCDVVRQNCRHAKMLGDWLEARNDFRLLLPVGLNVVCFQAIAPAGEDPKSFNMRLMRAVNEGGKVVVTPGAYKGEPGIRAAFSNWMTRDDDIAIITAALAAAYDAITG